MGREMIAGALQLFANGCVLWPETQGFIQLNDCLSRTTASEEQRAERESGFETLRTAIDGLLCLQDRFLDSSGPCQQTCQIDASHHQVRTIFQRQLVLADGIAITSALC